MQKKIVKNNLVAVILADQGSKWFLDHNIESLLFDPIVVDMIQRTVDSEQILQYISTNYNELSINYLPKLLIEWVPNRTLFKVEFLNDKETLILQGNTRWIEA